MTPRGSVTLWLDKLQQGDGEAANRLWGRYFRRLVGLARVALQGAPSGQAVEENVALSAFDSFCRGAAEGRFPDLRDRSGLWRLLVILTVRKASRLRRGGDPLDENAVAGETRLPTSDDFEWAGTQEPTPEFAAQVAKECERLLHLLGDNTLRSIAVWKLDSVSNQEIADKLGCCLSTVERKVQIIRRFWTEERPEPTP